MAPCSTAIIFPEWRLCVCCRSWRVPPVGEAPGLPHMGSPVCSVLLLSTMPMFCVHAQRTCLNNQQDIDAYACVEAMREIYDIEQRNSQGFSTAAAAVAVVPDILLIPSVYTTS